MGKRERRKPDKGKTGELNTIKTFIKAVEAGIIEDIIRPTYTNEPDDGLDLELKAPHNIGDIMESLKNGNEEPPPSSDTAIKVRVDNKNYNRKIGKPVAEKFVSDIEKNPNVSEHWLTGGSGLTAPAKQALDKASAPCRYYSQEDMNQIDNTLSSILEDENDLTLE